MLRKLTGIRSFTSKLYKSSLEALHDIADSAVIYAGGFGLAGVPENLIEAVAKTGKKNLTFITNSTGLSTWGLGTLVNNSQVKRIIASYVGGNPTIEKLYLSGEMELEFVPQGSLVERMRARQMGIGAFFTPTGVGTIIEDGTFPVKVNRDGSPQIYAPKKEVRIFNGKKYLLEDAFVGDFALVRAYAGDKYGNLRFRKVSRNFNPALAGAARVTVAEVEHIVSELAPEQVHLPGHFVDRVVEGERFSHAIERLKFRKSESGIPEANSARERIARRAAKEFKEGMYINLGIGLPTLIPDYMSKAADVTFQIENGLIGGGPYPPMELIDPDLINAGKETITAIPGYSMVHSTTSFGMMRGGHLHLTVLGGLQVSQSGDLANWYIPGKKATGIGGGMDLAASCDNVLVTMEHMAKADSPRLLSKCTYPLTAERCVKRVITEYAVFDFMEEGMILREIAKEITLSKLKEMTPANYIVPTDVKTMDS